MSTPRALFKNQETCVDIGPKELPIGSTDEYLSTCVLLEAYISNPSNELATVSLYDRQGTPIALFPPIVLPSGGMVSFNSANGRTMIDGITWSSSGAGVQGYMILIPITYT